MTVLELCSRVTCIAGMVLFLWLRNDDSWRVTALGVRLFLWLRNGGSWRVTGHGCDLVFMVEK